MAALLFLQESPGLTVQDAVDLHPLSPSLWLVCPYAKPVHLCGAAFWRYVIISTAFQELCASFMALVLSKDMMLFVHSMDLQPFALVLSEDWCSLSIVWTYSLLPCP